MSGLALPGGRTERRAAWYAAILSAGLTCAGLALMARAFALGPVDDAYISLRYAANWAAGRGLCFNPGEIVEGYTNFLLVALEAAAISCGVDPEWIMRWSGLGSLVLLAAGLGFFVARVVLPGDPLSGAAAGALACLNPMLVCWAFSGMESVLFALLLFTSLALLLDEGVSRSTTLSSLCLVLAAMTRPEGAVLLPCLLAVCFLRSRRFLGSVRYAAIFLSAYGLYFAARAWHFGHLFPNTFYAKLDYGGMALAARGAAYVWEFARAAPMLCLLGAAGLLLIRRAPLWVTGTALLAFAQVLLAIYEGGDHFPLFRFMVPVLPLLSVLAFHPADWFVRRLGMHRSVGLVLTFAALGATAWTVGRSERGREYEGDRHLPAFQFEAQLAQRWQAVGYWLRDHASPGASLATIAIGAIGFTSGRTIIDPYGITDAHVAHQARTLGRGYAGHEKYDVDYVFSRRPSYLLLVHVFTPLPVPKHELRQWVWDDFNKAMAGHPRLDVEYRYEHVRLTEGFLNLHVRRDLDIPSSDVGRPESLRP